MKRRIITSLKFLLAGVLFMSAMPAAQALITATVTSPQTNYTAGVNNAFTFNIVTTSMGTEWVDKYQFTFPAGVTFVSSVPGNGGGGCNSNAGVQQICAPDVSWKTNAGIPCNGDFARSGCGVYFAPGANAFTITVAVPAGFTGPLAVNLACYGDGFGAVPHEDLVNVVTFAQILPPVPCVFTCPANININLDPGACDAVVNYNQPTFTGDCNVLVGGPFSMTQNTLVGGITNALDCGGTPTSHWRVYTNGPAQFTINQLRMGNWNPGTINVFVHLYTGPVGGLLNQTLMTPLGSSGPTAVPGGQSMQNVALPNIVVPAGAVFAVEQRKVGAGNIFLTATNGNGQTAPSYISCGSTNAPPLPCNGGICPQPYANVGFGGLHLIQQLNGTTLQLLPPTIVLRPPSLPSGSTFPIGNNTVCYDLLNPTTGVVTNSCCFNINIIEFPNPINSLICNDLVYISLDEDCSYCLGADGVLEGGPYHCYDDYIVEVDRTLPYGNGPWASACFGPGDVGKTYQVRVTDSDTGIKCWGNVKIEDKLAPVLVCENVLLPCNFPDLSPENTQTSTFTLRFSASAGDLPQTIASNAEFTFDIDVPIDGIVNDVDLRMLAENGVWSATEFEITSPGAQTVWNHPAVAGCGPGWDIFARYDDEGLVSNLCVDYDDDLNLNDMAVFGFPPLNDINGDNPLGTWEVRVENDDFIGWGEDITVEILELYINLTGDFSPGFPNELEFPFCVFPSGNPQEYIVPAGCGTPQLDNCSDVTLSYLDTPVSDNCASGLSGHINRKWTARDASGNTSTCIQRIDLLRPALTDVVMPPDYDGIDAPFFLCGTGIPFVNGRPNPTPDYIEGLGLQGYPWIFGQIDGCSINYEYHDWPIEVCDGTVKYRREWTVIDWCIGDGFIYNQILKVVDDEGPTFNCPANLTVSTDPFACCATINLPDVIVTDNCSRLNKISGMIVVRDQYTNTVINMVPIGGSLTDFPGNNWWNRDTLAAFGWAPCLPIGTHTVTYVAEDDCGNTSECNFNVIVRDYVPPVAACDETTTISIGIDDPFDCYGPAGPPNQGPDALDACEFAGVTWVKATTFDDGSYDNCNGVKFTIRRMAPYSDCINNLNQVNGRLPCNDIFPDFPSEFERAISEQDSIKFYCCEVGSIQTIILSVYQVDINGNIQVGQDGTPIKNECMIQVEVQDKLKPACIPPGPVTVNCENFDPSLWAYGKPVVADNCCLDTSLVYQGQCGLTHTVNYSLFDTVCNRGTITRTFRAWDCHGFSSQCTQRVFVTYEQDYFIKFPNDVIVTVCDGTGVYGEPIFFGEDCELLGVSFEDEIFTVVPDACYKIERTWTIINWCTYNPNPNPITNHPTNLPGPTVSECGTLPPWAPTVVKINPGPELATNFCTFWDADANCYKYKQIIKIIDNQKPTGTYVVPDCSNQNWLTPNHAQLWNEMYWWNNGLQTHDLCEEPTDLCITGTDACSGANINIEYLLFLDLDGDGIMETVVSSTSLGIAGLGWNTVWYNNLNTPNFAGGTPRAFDERPVPFNQRWGFSIQETITGNTKTACVRWNTQQQQNTHVVPELPHGTHKIKWFISDGCGNNAEYEYTFTVRDCKPPTVVCINGLSVNIMPTGMITLWASDFLQYTEDNCTPAGYIKIGIRKCGTGTGFPVDAQGNPILFVTFDCTELGTRCVELWAIDAAVPANADFCETYLIVQDNFGVCPNANQINVAGALKTEEADGVEEGTVQISGTSSFTPPYNYFDLSDANGTYAVVNSVPLDATLVIAPEKDDNPLNGVTTYDLVLISKHILGIEPLDSPYKMIAADANKSGSITTFDIVEIRKLILGIYTDLPNNTSWRFVDKAFSFPNANNPFQTAFPETISIADAMVSQMDEDFAGVKIGDVNGTAVANATMQAEERTAGTAIFDLEDRTVKAGETFEVSFKSAQALKGFQFTATLNGLKAVGIVNAENVTEGNFNLDPENAMAVSIDGAQDFTVRFRAEKAGKLSEMLGVSGAITRAEAYGDAGRLGIAFRFDGKTIAGVGFELYQNQPNPFVNRTFIGFFLPEAAEATLSVYDETGRVVYQQKGQFAKGENTIALDRALINTTGMLYYKLETSTDAATKKMIQAK